jgi:hypothetical protein
LNILKELNFLKQQGVSDVAICNWIGIDQVKLSTYMEGVDPINLRHISEARFMALAYGGSQGMLTAMECYEVINNRLNELEALKRTNWVAILRRFRNEQFGKQLEILQKTIRKEVSK